MKFKSAYTLIYSSLTNDLMFTGKGKGRGRVRPEDEEELGNSRPSAPSTLFDFLESKMGTLTVEGKLLNLMFLEPRLDSVGGIVFPNLSSKGGS